MRLERDDTTKADDKKEQTNSAHEKYELYARLKQTVRVCVCRARVCVCVSLCVRAAQSVGSAARSTPSARRFVLVCAVAANWYTVERCVIDFYECVKNVCSDKNPPLNALKRDRDAFNVVIHQYINVFIYLDAARTVGSDILMARCAIYCVHNT